MIYQGLFYLCHLYVVSLCITFSEKCLAYFLYSSKFAAHFKNTFFLKNTSGELLLKPHFRDHFLMAAQYYDVGHPTL